MKTEWVRKYCNRQSAADLRSCPTYCPRIYHNRLEQLVQIPFLYHGRRGDYPNEEHITNQSAGKSKLSNCSGPVVRGLSRRIHLCKVLCFVTQPRWGGLIWNVTSPNIGLVNTLKTSGRD